MKINHTHFMKIKTRSINFQNLLIPGIPFGSVFPSSWVSLVVRLLHDIKTTLHRQLLKNEIYLSYGLVEALSFITVPTVVCKLMVLQIVQNYLGLISYKR
jgi:hypothetical protein